MSGDGIARLATGVSLHYAEAGPADAPVLVLLHAWLESGRVFDPMLPTLARFHVLIPDLRGHGDSGKPSTGYDLTTLAADVVAFLDATHTPAALLVGASSGGYLAQQVAAAHPGRVTGLVLSGTPRSLHGLRPPFADDLAGLTDPVDPAWARAFVEGFVPAGPVDATFLEARVAEALAVPAPLWRASFDGLVTSPAPRSDRILCPTLIVGGDRDALLGDDAHRLAADIRGSRRIEYEDTGHLVHWERPARLACDVAEFADSLHAG